LHDQRRCRRGGPRSTACDTIASTFAEGKSRTRRGVDGASIRGRNHTVIHTSSTRRCLTGFISVIGSRAGDGADANTNTNSIITITTTIHGTTSSAIAGEEAISSRGNNYLGNTDRTLWTTDIVATLSNDSTRASINVARECGSVYTTRFCGTITSLPLVGATLDLNHHGVLVSGATTTTAPRVASTTQGARDHSLGRLILAGLRFWRLRKVSLHADTMDIDGNTSIAAARRRPTYSRTTCRGPMDWR
jgi:hypothetical protein